MQEFLTQQNKNKIFWIPMLLALGAALYFALPTEPHIKSTTLAFIASVIILLFGKLNIILRAAMFFVCGFVYASFYTHNFVSTPVLKYSVRDKVITATVTDVDVNSKQNRLLLSVPANDLELSRDANIQVTISEDKPIPKIGDIISATVSVFPPTKAEAPETFNYARWAFFNNLTAKGYLIDYAIINHDASNNINKIRNTIHNKANSFLTDGLVLGYKNSIPYADKKIWTTAGVGHVWSISGFHMTLIGGWMFAFFFLLCRSCGFLTRRVPARISATICAWCVLFAYVCVSGFGVATWRAFLMTSLLFIALLLGRDAVSGRNISFAFLILFFINPHFVTQVGFQLSFAAVFGLIWFFGNKKFDNTNTITKIKNAIYAAIATSIVATIFTLPFIATHFSLIQLYGLLGNLVLLPIFSLIIMPLVLIGTIFAMFDVHLLLHYAMNLYNFTLSIAQKISEMPLSNITMPHIPDNAFVIFIIGLMFLIFIKPVTNSVYWIYRRINYLLFAICIVIGCLIVYKQPHPVFYATQDHELIGMSYYGKLKFNKSRASKHYFAFNAFRELNGEQPQNKNIRKKCPDGVCIYRSKKFTVAYIQKFVPLYKNIVNLCRDNNIDYIVSYFDISSPKCNHKILHNGFVIYKSGKIKYTPFNRWWDNPHE